MRTITDHKLNGLNDAITITALDEPGPIGANHKYGLTLVCQAQALTFPAITFQNGPIASAADYNGLTNEALLAVVIDRLRGFQGENPKPEGFGATVGDSSAQAKALSIEGQWGRFRCRENAVALTHLETALMFLQKRTRDRLARGVEGSHKV